jgi:PiT family inorganic phosphate transporter
LLSLFFAAGLALIGVLMSRTQAPENIEQAFAPTTVFAVCAMAFAHGSNDVANSVGPVVLVLDLLLRDSFSAMELGIPLWVFLLGGIGMALGMASLGFRVVRTIGQDITQLSPCRAFAVALAATATIVLASRAALPVSTTHTVVGAVLGVGLVGGTEAIQFRVVKKILVAWVVTVPFTALLAAALFMVARAWSGI